MLELAGYRRLIGFTLLGLAVLLIVGPIAWTFLNSIKTQIDIFTGTLSFTPTWENYDSVLLGRRSNILANVSNSLLVAALSTCVVIVVGTLAAYSLSRLGCAASLKAVFLGWTVLFHTIPPLTLVGPWYVMAREFGLYDTLTALTLIHIAMNLPMTIWIMMAFFGEIPEEMAEAASIDGCTPLQTFRKIMLPLAVPGLITAGVLAFVFSWNEFSVALNLTSRSNATVPVAIARYAQQYEILHGEMAAASIISTIPALLLMFFGQRFVVQGLTMGAVK